MCRSAFDGLFPGWAGCWVSGIPASTDRVGGSPVRQSVISGRNGAGFLLPQAADVNLTQPEAGFRFPGDPPGGLFPAVPLTPVRPQEGASRQGAESDELGGPSGPQMYLVRSHLTYIKMVCALLPRRSYYRTTRGVSFE